ncbi:MAG TPA: hypothetical protein VG056_04765 [Pirellulales bacterium]|jgi:hypothetical protein|nr:hypothetical protein [Pirellulales bacterium]
MYRDPLVEEVRAIRDRLAAECDFDIRKIVEQAKRRQAALKSHILPVERAAGSAPLAVSAEGTDSNIGGSIR